MKLDKNYSAIYVCPVSFKRLERVELFGVDGVCPRCGDKSRESVVHFDKVVGRWNRPTFFERLKGIKAEFLPSVKS